nr:MAG TPA: hypothetical protein [Caudoviricetes sp.]
MTISRLIKIKPIYTIPFRRQKVKKTEVKILC